ncbi:hypothetical protein ACCO45_003297 [Purpureocillium lilacinum]|uniref:Uncharacterized protein n=1 Tax=Purpureocillium lilacinum TaxID=33203 RepID=A0ACC4DZI9_PURLI
MAAPGEDESPHVGPSHPLKIFDAARKQDKFLYACAPMVRYSKLAFRQTVHQYGVDLCWTPMILAKEFNRSGFARDSGRPAPTILQFGANKPLELARASALAAPFVSGVDLNCGCPQSWACAETLGAALMNRRELVRDMVVETRDRLRGDGWAVGMEADVDSPPGQERKPWTFSIPSSGIPRIDSSTGSPSTRARAAPRPPRPSAPRRSTSSPPSMPARSPSSSPATSSTYPHCRSSPPRRPPGLATLTLKDDADQHPRHPNGTANGALVGDASTQPRPSNTNLSGFMSARGLLANPALFAGHPTCPWEAVEAFMCNVARCPLPFKLVVHHVSEMCGPGFATDRKPLLGRRDRARLSSLADMCELIDYLDEKLEERTGRKGGLRRDL